jgi:hypothetical protein
MASRLLWPELEADAEASGWRADTFLPTLTSGQVLDAVSRRHPMDGFGGMPGRWVFCREVQAATGSYSDNQRFDAVAIGLVPSTKYARVVYEVKISRADWLRELRPLAEVRYGGHRMSRKSVAAYSGEQGLDELRTAGYQVAEQHKWDAALAVSTEYWVAAPPRCVQVSELPPEAGLLEVRAWGKAREMRARIVRPAPVRDTPVPDPGFWAAVLRRAAERRQRAVGPDAAP